MTKEQEHILASIKSKLVETLPANGSAVLFGSQARGDQSSDSDWDILIIIDKDKVSLAENAAITYPLVMVGWNYGVEINPILYTKGEWERNRHTPFYENVERDGKRIA